MRVLLAARDVRVRRALSRLLELDGDRVVGELVRRGRAVIAVSSGSTRCAAVLAAGARACLEEDADFPDRLAQVVRAVAGPLPSPPPA